MASPSWTSQQDLPQLQMQKLLVDLNARLEALDQKINSTFTAIQLTSVNNVKQSEDSLRQMIQALERTHEQNFKELSDKQDKQLDSLVDAIVQDNGLAKLFSQKLAEAEQRDVHSADITPTSPQLELADGSGETTGSTSLEVETPDSKTAGATALKKSKAATVEDPIDNDDSFSPGASSAKNAPAKCGETTGASRMPSSSSHKAHHSPSTPNAKQKTATATPSRAPIQRMAIVDYATVFRFIDGETFERYLAQIDHLWYGTKDASYRATLCECIRTDPHQPVSNWVKRNSPEFIAKADWPDLKHSLKELFSPSLTTVGDYRKWAKTMGEVAPDFFYDPCEPASWTDAAAAVDCEAAGCGCDGDVLGHYLISMLGRTTFASHMGADADPIRGDVDGRLGSWGSSLSTGNLSGAFKSPASTSSTAPVSRSKDSAEDKPPPPSYDQATDAHTCSAGSSGSGASQSRTTSNSEDSARASSEAGPSRLGGNTASLPPKDGKASSADSKTKAKVTADVDAMIKTLPQFDGLAENFYDWTRQVDHMWYTIRDIEVRRAFLFALSKTFTGRARAWLSLASNVWLEHTEWPDWRASMATFLGGPCMFNAREEPSHVVVYPRPMRFFEDASRPPLMIDEVPLPERRFK